MLIEEARRLSRVCFPMLFAKPRILTRIESRSVSFLLGSRRSAPLLPFYDIEIRARTAHACAHCRPSHIKSSGLKIVTALTRETLRRQLEASGARCWPRRMRSANRCASRWSSSVRWNPCSSLRNLEWNASSLLLDLQRHCADHQHPEVY
jgi:hypothetical protein